MRNMASHDGFVGCEVMVLDFEEEVAAAEDLFEVAGGGLGSLVVAGHEVLGDLPGEAAGEADEALQYVWRGSFCETRGLR